MKKLLFILPALLFADVNPFNAGNLNSNAPYGLSSDEKVILENKKDISSLHSNINNVQKNIAKIELKLSNYDDVINNKLSAFPTVIDEVNNAMNDINALKKENNQTQSQINNIDKEINVLKNKINSVENNITVMRMSIKEMVKIQNQNFLALKQSILEIVNKINQPKQGLSLKHIFLKAKAYFLKNKLNSAKKLFIYTLSKNYLPATSSFYLGEIAYKQKKYNDALAYYKKSINLYPKKTSFTSELLYHTGISFVKINNKKVAKITFKKLIYDYPLSKYAKLAKIELEKIK